MPINTKIEGNPEGMRAAATWLRNDLAGAVKGSTDKVYSARNDAEGGLRGDAADAMRAKLTTGGRQADDFEHAITSSAGHVDEAADVLQGVQQDMQRIRNEAMGAGLQVTDDAIQDPGKGPAAPGPAPTGDAATPQAMKQHRDAVQAQQDHQAKVAVYNKANNDAEGVNRRWKQQVEKAAADFNKNKDKSYFTIAGFGITGGLEAMKVKNKSILTTEAQSLRQSAARAEAHAAEMAKAGKGIDAKGIYQNLDAAAADRAAAGRVKPNGVARFGKIAGRISNVGGGVLAAGGVAYDIAHGKPVVQAVTSGAAGFGASVATGAIVGTAIGGPVGTEVPRSFRTAV